MISKIAVRLTATNKEFLSGRVTGVWRRNSIPYQRYGRQQQFNEIAVYVAAFHRYETGVLITNVFGFNRTAVRKQKLDSEAFAVFQTFPAAFDLLCNSIKRRFCEKWQFERFRLGCVHAEESNTRSQK